MSEFACNNCEDSGLEEHGAYVTTCHECAKGRRLKNQQNKLEIKRHEKIARGLRKEVKKYEAEYVNS